MEITIYDFFAVILPALISMVVKPKWENHWKLLTAIGLCVVLAGIQTVMDFIFTGKCTLAELPNIIKSTVVLVMTSYAMFWRPFGFAEKIEEKINP